MGVKEKAFSFLRVLDMDYMKRLLSIMAISLLFSPICLGKDSNELPDLFTMVKEVIQLRIDEASKPFQEVPQQLQDEVDAIKREEYPQPSTLTKGEFESTINFRARADKAREDYQMAVNDYNARLDAVKHQVDEFYRNIPQLPKWRRNQIIEETLLGMLGTPQIDNVSYDADTQTFFLDIISDSLVAEDYRISLAMEEQIPNHQARELKKSLQLSAKPEISFSLSDGNISWGSAYILVGGNRYSMFRLGGDDTVYTAQKSMSYTPELVDTQVQALLDIDNIGNQSRFTEGEKVQFSDSPEINAEQRRVLELRRKLAQKELNMSEKERLQAERRALEEKLRSLDNGTITIHDDLPQLFKQAKVKPIDNHKWLFAVAISDYDEAPDVSFADRSGQAFVKAMQQAGVPKENTVQLIGHRATGTRITSRLRRTLNQLGPKDTLYFYYAGHGVPDRKKAASYLLPYDGDMGSYEDPKLETNTIYELLAKSDVGRAVVFMDACFSGRADKDRLVFEGVAGIVVKRKIKIDTNRITLMTAGKSDQFANQLEDKGHRLFSYYLIKGMLENDFDLGQVSEYVQDNVSRESRKLGITYMQEPEIYGKFN